MTNQYCKRQNSCMSLENDRYSQRTRVKKVGVRVAPGPSKRSSKVRQGCGDWSSPAPRNYHHTRLYPQPDYFARLDRVNQHLEYDSPPSQFRTSAGIAHQPTSTHLTIRSTYSQSKAPSSIMPYNNTPIAPNKEITGHVSLPCK